MSLATIFGPDGLLAQKLPQYEPRSQQVHMADAVAEKQHIEGVADILAKPVTIKALARSLAKTLTAACAV